MHSTHKQAGPSWARAVEDAAGVSTSRGARSSGSHRYSAEASDGSDDEGEVVGIREPELHASLSLRSMPTCLLSPVKEERQHQRRAA
jgi:hypothetical protein